MTVRLKRALKAWRETPADEQHEDNAAGDLYVIRMLSRLGTAQAGRGADIALELLRAARKTIAKKGKK